MKIEAEVERGCSASGAEPCPTAQERSSIGRPEWQPTGCGGCGPSSDNNTSPFDCEHFQFIDEDEDEENEHEGVSCCENVPATQAPTGQEDEAALSCSGSPRDAAELSTRHEMGESESVGRQVSFERPKELRSVLKKAGRDRGTRSNRVTFDEAVTLYSDEDVQMLALTTGPDIVYADVFYMFEPPIEYQDVPPFEPPAEYRDSDEAPTTQPEDPVTTAAADEPAATEKPEEPAAASTPDLGDVAVSKETESTDSATDEVARPESDGQPPGGESTLESDKLFERFLEAEREFAVDEELNSVFHALETDFTNDDKNGALDDNFFRKLISLLSSAEGDVAAEVNDYFAEPHFGKLQVDLNAEDDDNSQTHSRTLSEADSDCSISSQDTIIVRFGEDENEQTPGESGAALLFAKPDDSTKKDDVPDDHPLAPPATEGFDDVFTEVSESASSSDERPRPPAKGAPRAANGCEESLSRQSSGEQSVNSQDPPQDADDSTSSDSRSGEVEEEIRLDDIGYDEEDAEDYDEESFRGMAHGNSKIRRIIKKNALQCTLFRGMEAKRRQQPGAKYPRPKSPLLSQESLVEKLRWLTTIDEQRDDPHKFLSKPPDVILSTGGVPVNGSAVQSHSSDDDVAKAQAFQQPAGFYPLQQPRHVLPAGYYVRRDGFPPTHHPSLPRQRVAAFPGHTPIHHTLPYTQQNRVVAHPVQQQQQQQQYEQRPASATVPRNFRDWRIIQRITGSGRESRSPPQAVAADYVRCPGRPPDELEQFVEKDSRRMDMIRKRYSVAASEEEDDPTFGFARRPSVRGVQNRIQSSNPSENSLLQGGKLAAADHPYVALFPEDPQHPRSAGYDPTARVWTRRPEQQPMYGRGSHQQQVVPMHIHRASVALTELPGSATLPYAHRKPDARYHSYAESVYGGARTLPAQGAWLPPNPPMLQVPPPSHSSKDERGVPEGASSSPKISSDSLYPGVPDAIATKEDGVIYYSLNV